MHGKNILLHICCAPCSIEQIEGLLKKGYKIYGYFYNPNIHPFDEYLKRRDSTVKYLEKLNLSYEVGDYEIYEYFKNLRSNFKISNRCRKCYELRLGKTAAKTTELNFKNFSTTLLFNPHKDYSKIAKIGEKIAKESNLRFINPKLKRDYWENKKRAKDECLYSQKYCGCVFSSFENKEFKK